MIDMSRLTWLLGEPVATGQLKANPEDFIVEEDLGFEPDGEGEHLLVRIRKNGCNTQFVPSSWRVLPKCIRAMSATPV